MGEGDAERRVISNVGFCACLPISADVGKLLAAGDEVELIYGQSDQLFKAVAAVASDDLAYKSRLADGDAVLIRLLYQIAVGVGDILTENGAFLCRRF